MDQLNPLILVVEDDDDGRETICALLEIGGYATAQVRNGQEALNYLRSNPPPFVILLDLLMPVMDGWKFIAVQSQDERIARIPVLVLSAVSAQRRIGPHHVLRKPIDGPLLFRLLSEYRKR
jgi:CheY-like chemotaxis protein